MRATKLTTKTHKAHKKTVAKKAIKKRIIKRATKNKASTKKTTVKKKKLNSRRPQIVEPPNGSCGVRFWLVTALTV